MASFEWKDKFSVHVDEMDDHHKKLLGYLTELQKEIQSGNSTRQAGNILIALGEYSRLHFTEEERLMRAIGHPELATQINQHAYFSNEVAEMARQLNLGTLPGRSLVAFLRDWFIIHIIQEDSKYGELIKQGEPLT